MAKPNLLGPWGESLAAQYLKNKGYTVLACNYSCRFGEIDLVVKKRGILAFVEVKLRKSSQFVQAREYVDRRKQNRVLATAQLWLSENPTTLQPRFDVIEIYAPQGMETAQPQIIHLEDAFQ